MALPSTGVFAAAALIAEARSNGYEIDDSNYAHVLTSEGLAPTISRFDPHWSATARRSVAERHSTFPPSPKHGQLESQRALNGDRLARAFDWRLGAVCSGQPGLRQPSSSGADLLARRLVVGAGRDLMQSLIGRRG